jgi:hypothetical protein
MRTIVAVVLSLALGSVPALAENPQNVNQGLEAGAAFSAIYINAVYTPVKVVVAVLGGVGGALAGLLTGGDQRAAYALWVPLMGGDYFVRPENLAGEQPLAFFGSDYQDRPSQANGLNDSTYAYDALYKN